MATRRPNLVIAGTPGTGKSRLLEELAPRFPAYRILNISDLIKEEKLYDAYSKSLDTFEFSEGRVRKRVKEVILDGGFFLESHSVAVFPRELVDRVLVLSISTEVLFDRLTARGYSKAKREENIECEIMQVVLEEAVERFGKDTVMQAKCENEKDLESAIEVIKAIIPPQ